MRSRSSIRLWLAMAGIAVGLGASPSGGAAAPLGQPNAAAEQHVLVGAGDIAGPWLGDDQTANLLDKIPGTVFTLGDNSYLMGSTPEYMAWYELTWGRHKARTRPAPGNHDYEAGGGGNGGAYFDYFGAAAGPPNGYYSYDLGEWHVVVLNQECAKIGGCGPTSAQAQWLRNDLGTHPTACTVAIMHYPRFNSGGKGQTEGIARGQTFWDILYEHHAEIVMSGDEHVYERFAPQTPKGQLDTAHGIRHFTVGTGGGLSGSFPAGSVKPNSEARIAGVFGVLKLTLGQGSYTWEFVPVEGATATDSGSGVCHGPAMATSG
jgi:hypothetical protein